MKAKTPSRPPGPSELLRLATTENPLPRAISPCPVTAVIGLPAPVSASERCEMYHIAPAAGNEDSGEKPFIPLGLRVVDGAAERGLTAARIARLRSAARCPRRTRCGRRVERPAAL